MPSSTFSSSGQATAQLRIRKVKIATVPFLILLALEMGGVELLTRFGLSHISQIQQRTMEDRAGALAIRPAPGAPPSVLLAGNSLLLEALDYPELEKELLPQVRPVRYTVEQTAYYDWYYALRNLFRRGSRPSAVVFSLDIAELIQPGSEIPDFVSNFMLGLPDLLPYAHAIHLDNTETSTEVFSHFSWFFAARSRLRNLFLVRTCPQCIGLIHTVTWGSPQFPPDAEVIRTAAQRMHDMDALCRSAHSRLVFLVPPSLRNLNRLELTAARRAGVDVMMPVAPNQFSRSLFRDGFHLNARGAAVFTPLLESQMAARFAHPVHY